VTFSGRVLHSQAAATGKARFRRWLNNGYVEQQAMMTTQSEDAEGPRQQTTGGILQRGTAELSDVGICIPEQPA